MSERIPTDLLLAHTDGTAVAEKISQEHKLNQEKMRQIILDRLNDPKLNLSDKSKNRLREHLDGLNRSLGISDSSTEEVEHFDQTPS